MHTDRAESRRRVFDTGVTWGGTAIGFLVTRAKAKNAWSGYGDIVIVKMGKYAAGRLTYLSSAAKRVKLSAKATMHSGRFYYDGRVRQAGAHFVRWLATGSDS